MKKTKRNGFVLILVIIALVVIAAEMFVLTGVANTLLFQANAAYLEACNRNLVASGLAWVRHSAKDKNLKSFNTTIELDLAHINIPDGSLIVTVGESHYKTLGVQIKASCNRGRQTLSSEGKYFIKL
jgi:hypothetical protein